MIKSGRYNNRSEAIQARPHSLEEPKLAEDIRQFEKIFIGGHSGEPASKTVRRIVARQKSSRKPRL